MSQIKSFPELVLERKAEILAKSEKIIKKLGKWAKLNNPVMSAKTFHTIVEPILSGWGFDKISDWTEKKGERIPALSIQAHYRMHKSWYADVRAIGQQIQSGKFTNVVMFTGKEEAQAEKFKRDLESGALLGTTVDPDQKTESRIEGTPLLTDEERRKQVLQSYSVSPADAMQGKQPYRQRINLLKKPEFPKGKLDLFTARKYMQETSIIKAEIEKQEESYRLKKEKFEAEERAKKNGTSDAWLKHRMEVSYEGATAKEIQEHTIPPKGKVSDSEQQKAVVDLQKRGLLDRMMKPQGKKSKGTMPSDSNESPKPAEPEDTTGGNSQA